jgi:hypothetical protein
LLPPYPDLGEHYWALCGDGAPKELLLMGCHPKTLSEAPEGGLDVHFNLYAEAGGLCGTLHTSQSRKEVLRILSASPPGQVIVSGRLSETTVSGASGEQYRMILGRVEPQP